MSNRIWLEGFYSHFIKSSIFNVYLEGLKGEIFWFLLEIYPMFLLNLEENRVKGKCKSINNGITVRQKIWQFRAT
ncbi:MAG: hypothetical protein ACTSVO_05630 [Candidatus Heimdallarchaeaceae archaeon]